MSDTTLFAWKAMASSLTSGILDITEECYSNNDRTPAYWTDARTVLKFNGSYYDYECLTWVASTNSFQEPTINCFKHRNCPTGTYTFDQAQGKWVHIPQGRFDFSTYDPRLYGRSVLTFGVSPDGDSELTDIQLRETANADGSLTILGHSTTLSSSISSIELVLEGRTRAWLKSRIQFRSGILIERAVVEAAIVGVDTWVPTKTFLGIHSNGVLIAERHANISWSQVNGLSDTFDQLVGESLVSRTLPLRWSYDRLRDESRGVSLADVLMLYIPLVTLGLLIGFRVVSRGRRSRFATREPS